MLLSYLVLSVVALAFAAVTLSQLYFRLGKQPRPVLAFGALLSTFMFVLSLWVQASAMMRPTEGSAEPVIQPSDRSVLHNARDEAIGETGTYNVKVFFATDRRPVSEADLPKWPGPAGLFTNALVSLCIAIGLLGISVLLSLRRSFATGLCGRLATSGALLLWVASFAAIGSVFVLWWWPLGLWGWSSSAIRLVLLSGAIACAIGGRYLWSRKSGHVTGSEAIFGLGRDLSFVGACVSFAAMGVLVICGIGLWAFGQPNLEPVTVYYGTERNTDDDPMSYGICRVSVPRDLRMGSLPAPQIYKFEYAWNPQKHVILRAIETLGAMQFFRTLRATTDYGRRESGNSEAFVFVHGFNVSFGDAARRTGQLAYDLKFKGPPILFSWPSKVSKKAYDADTESADWAIPHLERFLKSVVENTGVERVYLIAHSMGNRCLTRAFQRLGAKDSASVFRELILTAPDIDVELFKHDILPAIVGKARRVTLYASSTDTALQLSHEIHQIKRAGDCLGEPIVIPPMESLDVSAVDSSLIGHSYYGDNSSVITDMHSLIHDGKPARDRAGTIERSGKAGVYWALRGRN